MMRKWRVEFGITILLFVLVVLAFSFVIPSESYVTAQDGVSCEEIAAKAVSMTQQACTDIAPGELCVGYAGVTVADATGETVSVEQGEIIALADVEGITTSPFESGIDQWGIATLNLTAGLPTRNSDVTAVLFGDARIALPMRVESDRPTLEVYNSGSAEVNLRNGAGITYDVVGQLAANETALADGRNEQGDWLRIQYAGGIAWVFTPLIGWDGDQVEVDALEVLLPNDVTPVMQASELFQAFTLVTETSACEAAPSGLLLHYTGEVAASIQVNQVNLEFTDATLLVTASASDVLEVKVLSGISTVTARGIPQEVAAGSVAQVDLGGEDGLTPAGAPVILRTYAFPAIAYAPLALLPDQIVCTVGLPTQNADVQLRVGPGLDRGEIGTMSANASYKVLGWANDSEGSPWWELDTGEQTSWTAQSDVRAIGACTDVAQVEAPPLVFAPAAPAASGGESAGSSGTDFAPAANSVWQMVPGADNMTGECSGAPAINFCDHLAAIAPVQGGITWKGMEPAPYLLTQVQPNVYAYSGPNVAGTGTVNMTLSFASENTLNMTMSLVLSSEPNCQHVYYYSGSRNW